jgi:hypothetical protein
MRLIKDTLIRRCLVIELIKIAGRWPLENGELPLL